MIEKEAILKPEDLKLKEFAGTLYKMNQLERVKFLEDSQKDKAEGYMVELLFTSE